jgi:hypothetical protein
LVLSGLIWVNFEKIDEMVQFESFVIGWETWRGNATKLLYGGGQEGTG